MSDFFRGFVAATGALFLSLNTDAARDAETPAIVAQLKAEHERRISGDAPSLAREAAMRGCPTDAQPGFEGAAAPESNEQTGSGFWDRIPAAGAARGRGHDCLRRRGRY
jgi:hypothetical protein